jgi:hypothetical protein
MPHRGALKQCALKQDDATSRCPEPRQCHMGVAVVERAPGVRGGWCPWCARPAARCTAMSHCGAQDNSDATLRCGSGEAGAGVTGGAVRAVSLMDLVRPRGAGRARGAGRGGPRRAGRGLARRPVTGAGPLERHGGPGWPGNRQPSGTRQSPCPHPERTAPIPRRGAVNHGRCRIAVP